MSKWRNVRLGDVCDKITDGTHHSPANHPTGDYKYITAKNIKPWGLDLSDITYIDAATHREIYSRCDVRKNDVLYIKDGATTGRVALNTLDEQFSLLSSVGVLRPGSNIRPKFLMYALQAPHVRDPMLDRMAGVAITRLTLKKLKDAVIPLAPINQQDAIVTEIEKQFSRLDEAVAGLRRVKANLKRYKAAILKAAVESRLVATEADLARREGRSYETGAQLLQRILETRRSQWQGKGKYKEPTAPDTGELPELPEGWAWANCDTVVTQIEAGASFKCTERPPEIGETGVLKVSAVTWGSFDESESKTCNHPKRVEESYLVHSGDFLFSRANTIDLVGACVIVQRIAKRLMLSDKTLRFKIASPIEGTWLLICLRSKLGRNEIERLATGNQESMRNIGQERIRQIRLPLPPLAEQHRIVAEVDRLLFIAREAETEVNNNLERAKRLRDAVLQKAFTPATAQQASAHIIEFKAQGKPDNRKRHFTRAVLSAEIVHRLHGEPTFGRVKHQKIFHLCEYLACIEAVEGHYHRKAAGPLDNKLIYANEKELKDQKWYETVERDGGNDGHGHSYRPLSKAGGHQKYLNGFGQEQLAIIDRLIELMRNWKTERCEIFSTAFAAWNDLVIWGKPATDEAILHEILHRWNDSKRRIDESRWRKAIGWMRQEGFVPSGFGKPTRTPGAIPPAPTIDKGN